MSEQLFKPSDCKTCIFNNSTHSDRVHRIVSWNGDETRSVTHYNVLALTHNSEASLFERLYRPEMINAGNFRHRQTVTSTSRTSAAGNVSFIAAKYSRIASRIFSTAS